MIAVIAKVRVKADQRAKFLRYLEDDVSGSLREESGCLRFDVLQDDANANCFHLYEVYRDRAAYDVHQAAPYFKRIFAEAADTFDGAPDVYMTTTLLPREPAHWAKR